MRPTLLRLLPFRLLNLPAALLIICGVQGLNACNVSPTGVVAWWKGEGNADDLLSANDGQPQGDVAFEVGKIGNAFHLDGMGGHVMVPASASLAVRSFTMEAWINPQTIDAAQPLFEYAAPPGISGLHFWLSATAQDAPAPGNLFAHLRSTTGTYYLLETAPNLIPAHSWSHIALAYDAIEGSARIWINGGMAASAEGVWIVPKTDLPLYIGHRPSESQEGLAGRTFWGRMDEITVYNRALEPVEIQGIYDAGLLGKCPPELPSVTMQPRDLTVSLGNSATFEVLGFGAPPLSYQWFHDGLLLEGATARQLTIDQVQTNQAGSYQARVSNEFGSVSSDPALLRVVVAPTIIEPPLPVVVLVGGQVTMSVKAVGTAPLAYQWQHNGHPIAGAIGSMLILNNIQPSQGGAYRVVVSNIGGIAISEPSTLRVGSGILASSVENGTFSLSVAGEAGCDYLIETSTDLLLWEPLVTVFDPEPAWSFSDSIIVGRTTYFYRLRRLP